MKSRSTPACRRVEATHRAVVRGLRLAAVAAAVLTPALAASAQTINISPLYQFSKLKATKVNVDGAYPTQGMLQTADGTIYGTCYAGGADRLGTLFSLSPTGVFTVAHSFAGTDGVHPSSGVIQGWDNAFYGTTISGGTRTFGTIFKLRKSGVFETLHNFHGATDGAYPVGGVTEAFDLKFYGTTSAGGSHGDGTIYVFNARGHFETLYNFTGGVDSGGPTTSLTQVPSGNGAGLPLLVGTTKYGGKLPDGSPGAGTIFAFSPAPPNSTGQPTFTTVYTFTGGVDGGEPNSQLVAPTGGNIYGTTSVGGAYGYGTIFDLNSSGTLTVLANLTAPNEFGPQSTQILASDGTLLSIASAITSGFPGDLFQTTTTGRLNVISPIDGGASSMLQAQDGSLIGFLADGGVNKTGEIFKLADSALPPPFSLTSIFPRSTYVGAPGFTLDVYGKQLNTNATVLWNGQPLPTTFVSSGELTAAVGASLLTSVNTATVSVDNHDGAVANSLAFYTTPTRLDLRVGAGWRDSSNNIWFPLSFVNSGNEAAKNFVFYVVKLDKVPTITPFPVQGFTIPAHSTTTMNFEWAPDAAKAGSAQTVNVQAHFDQRALWLGYVAVTAP